MADPERAHYRPDQEDKKVARFSEEPFQDLLTEAILAYDSEENLEVTTYLATAYYNPETHTFRRRRFQKDKRKPEEKMLFATLASDIIDGRVQAVGEDSPFRPELQELLKKQFPQNFLPFEEVPYTKFSPMLWFYHPEFQRELGSALDAYHSQDDPSPKFWAWLASADYNEQTDAWETRQNFEGKWKSLRENMFANPEFKQFLEEQLRHTHASEVFPLELRRKIKETFPLEFETNQDAIPYELLPLEERITHPQLHLQLYDALTTAPKTENKRHQELNYFLLHIFFDKEIDQWVYGEKNRGPFAWTRNIPQFAKLLADPDGPFPEELRQKAAERFPETFREKKDGDYEHIPAIQWFRNTNFQEDLNKVVKAFEQMDTSLSFLVFLRTVRPQLEKNWDSSYLQEDGPWLKLSNFCTQSLTRYQRHWTEFFTRGDIPEETVALLIKTFPQEFADHKTVKEYFRMKPSSWLESVYCQQDISTALKSLALPPEVHFTTWLEEEMQKITENDSPEEGSEKSIPWEKLANILHVQKLVGRFPTYEFLFDRYAISDTLTLQLRKNFPADFDASYTTVEAKITAVQETLRKAGFSTASSTLLINHLLQTVSPDAFDQFQRNLPKEQKGRERTDPEQTNLAFFTHIYESIKSGLPKGESLTKDYLSLCIKRVLRDSLYTHLQESGLEPTAENIATALQSSFREVAELNTQISNSEFLNEIFLSFHRENLEALEQTKHLEQFFTHHLSLEQRQVIYHIASSDGKYLLAHPPGEGKSAMALAGIWEYLRNRNQLQNSVVLFLGTNGVAENIQLNIRDTLNRDIEHQYQILNWRHANSVGERYDLITKKLEEQQDHPLIIPLSFSMLEGGFKERFHQILSTLQEQGKTVVPICDEYHNVTGNKIYKEAGEHIAKRVIPVSSRSQGGEVFCIGAAEAEVEVDNLLRAQKKSLLITGTPMNTHITELVHAASVLYSSEEGHYPPFSLVNKWINDPVWLSTALHKRMFRSTHLSLPPVEMQVMHLDYTGNKDNSDYEDLSPLSKISMEVQAVLPQLIPVLRNLKEKPILIAIPYVYEDRETSAASSQYITRYLKEIGIDNVERLDSTVPQKRSTTIINQFREDRGVDLITISPAHIESKDYQGKRPIDTIISIAGSTIRSYEQAVRRVVRHGNTAERVQVIIPVVENAPFSYLKNRLDRLTQRLELATAILDPDRQVKSPEHIIYKK